MGALFKKPKPPADPQPPAPMPDANSPSVLEARRKASSAAMARAGRASTILSAGNGSGDNFGSKTLGG